MPKFSQESFSKLTTCHQDLQTLFYEVIKTIDCQVLEGYRNQVDQDADFEKGTTKLQWPNGKHNYQPSYAVDVAPYPVDWKNLKRFYWFAGFVLATATQLKISGKMTYGIRWGGDFNHDYDITNDKGLIDLPHYELIV